MTNLRRELYSHYLKTDAWRRRREAAISRSGGLCEHCGSSGRLEVHHRTYDRVFDESPSDLVALCLNCHAAEHGAGVVHKPRPALEVVRPQAKQRCKGIIDSGEQCKNTAHKDGYCDTHYGKPNVRCVFDGCNRKAISFSKACRKHAMQRLEDLEESYDEIGESLELAVKKYEDAVTNASMIWASRNEMMNILGCSETSIYSWRSRGLLAHRMTENGEQFGVSNIGLSGSWSALGKYAIARCLQMDGDGKTAEEIANYMSSKGAPLPGARRWTVDTVKGILVRNKR